MSFRRRPPRDDLRGVLVLACFGLSLSAATEALAQQRSAENALAASDDAFGSVVGNERTGIYSEGDIRGFSPIRAGNVRVEGVYFDQQTFIAGRARAGSRMRVGIAALDYPFPAPTGIVDVQLRQASPDPSMSLQVGANYYGAGVFEIDLRGPLIKNRLTVTAGVSVLGEASPDGAKGVNKGGGVVPRILLDRGEITVILSHWMNRKSLTRVIYSTPGAFLPPLPVAGRYVGQDWAEGEVDNSAFGAIWRQSLGETWTLRSGAFLSRQLRLKNYTEIFSIADAAGLGRHSITSDPRQVQRSYSGEIQLTKALDTDRLRNRFLFTIRARDRLAESGGSDSRDLGAIRVGERDPEAEPNFVYRALDQGRIKQVTGAVGYMARVPGWGQFNFGLQKTRYRQTFTRAGAAPTRLAANPWLYNATLVLAPGNDWLVYANYVRGLEESGAAPENAANRNEIMPAARTTQIEGGGRIKTHGVTMAASAFQIEKPYFTLDLANRFTELGAVRHKGIEASISGALLDKKLNLLIGGVFMRPVVVGEAVRLGRVGGRPVGVSSAVLRVDAEYQTGIKGVSITAAALHNGKRAASARPYAELGGKQLMAPGFTTFDIGVRHRLTLHKVPMSWRAVVGNVFDKRSLRVAQANSFQLNDTRRVAVFLSADF